MKKYIALLAPEPEEWLAIDESERINLVEIFHEDFEEEVPKGKERIHASIHVIVENQLIETEYAPIVVKKLIQQGLDRHDALHAVGAIIAEDLFNIHHSKEKEHWDEKAYIKRLKNLTAKRWKKGIW
ncbi:MAG: DUF1841 family protein [Methylococcaceae bacterium]|nr:DUF1841 family protein [Methylococcaceae bacterium]